MDSPEGLAMRANACRAEGDLAGEAQALLELESHGFSERERHRLRRGESLGAVLGCSPASAANLTTSRADTAGL